jgi:hypothetical protein
MYSSRYLARSSGIFFELQLGQGGHNRCNGPAGRCSGVDPFAYGTQRDSKNCRKTPENCHSTTDHGSKDRWARWRRCFLDAHVGITAVNADVADGTARIKVTRGTVALSAAKPSAVRV